MESTGENITREQLFQKIADASLFGNLNLFIGAGFSMSVFENSITEGPLSWIELLDEVCEKKKIILDDKDKKYSSCPEIASKISQKILENNSNELKTLEEASNELKSTNKCFNSLVSESKTKRRLFSNFKKFGTKLYNYDKL